MRKLFALLMLPVAVVAGEPPQGKAVIIEYKKSPKPLNKSVAEGKPSLHDGISHIHYNAAKDPIKAVAMRLKDSK